MCCGVCVFSSVKAIVILCAEEESHNVSVASQASSHGTTVVTGRCMIYIYTNMLNVVAAVRSAHTVNIVYLCAHTLTIFWCCAYIFVAWPKGSCMVTHVLEDTTRFVVHMRVLYILIYLYINIYIHICICMYVCSYALSVFLKKRFSRQHNFPLRIHPDIHTYL